MQLQTIIGRHLAAPFPFAFPCDAAKVMPRMSEHASVVDVTGIGQNATDVIIRLPRFPEFNSKLEFESASLLAGGQVASAMEACARWGLKARYVGKVGDDTHAEFQRQQLERAGVEARWFRVPQCSSQTAYILVDSASGERTILWRRDQRLALSPDELRREWVTQSRALLVDGHNARVGAVAARWAREASIPVVADADSLYDGMDELLAQVDYLVGGEDFAERILGEPDPVKALPELSRRFGCRVSAATLGCDGVLAWLRQEQRFLYCPAYRVDAVDTTGAGDIFHGAFVYALLQGWPMPRILDFSCAAAALNCTALGARGGIKPISEIEALCKRGERYEPPGDLARYIGDW